ncbi:N-acetylmuramoyl-L-alanine amidase, partial [Mammaliicoccus sciuri]
QQYYNSLINAPLSRLENGIAHYYIDRNTTWRALDTFRIAWHTANAYGNNNYIGYEVVQSMSASDKDFKANEQAVFKQAAEDLK